MTYLLIIVIVVIVIVLFVLYSSYNRLVSLNQEAQEAWSDITVQLKRRYDLIPNIVNSVKGYAAHEKTVFEDVTNARTKAMSASTPADTAKAENQIQSTLKSLFAVAENYPDLKASQNFLQLQAELVDTEDKIQASRRFYNGIARDFNTRRKIFPTNIFANRLGFKTDKEFFELSDTEQAQADQPVDVQF